MDYHMKIIYINEKKLSYNEATHACAILNATLLTMRSWQKWFMVQQLFNSSSDWDKQACVSMKIYNVKQLIFIHILRQYGRAWWKKNQLVLFVKTN